MTGECAAVVLYPLNDLVGALEVFPNKSPDARVVGVHLVAAIRCLVLCGWTVNENIVNERYCHVGDLGLEDMSDIVVENWYQVCPSHRKGDDVIGPEWGLECCIIVQFLIEASLIVSNIEIKNTATSTTCKLLSNLIGIQRHT